MKQIYFIFFIFLALNAFSQNTFQTFFDDFNDNANQWWEGSNKDKNASIFDGSYTFESFQKDTRSIVYREMTVDPEVPYTIEANIRLDKGKKNMGFGLVLGWDNWDNYCRILISDNGMVQIWQIINGSGQKVVNWKKLPDGIIRPKGEFNHVKLERGGDGTTHLYINGKIAATPSNVKFVGKKYGFILTDKQKITADYIRIKYLSRPINVVDNPTPADKIHNMGSAINSKYTEKGPIISVDGRTLYFTLAGSPQNIGGSKKDDAMYSHKEINGGWNQRQFFPAPINNSSSNFLVSITPDGNSALFGNAYMSDGSMKQGVSYGVKRNGQWMMPTPLQIANFENKNQYVNYFLTADGGHLLMAIENSQSKGGLDIFVSEKLANGSWGTPKNLGPNINTFADDFAPFLAADGTTMYFASKGHPGYGSADIFMTKRLDDTWLNWSEPQNLGNGINTKDWDAYFTVDARGEKAYMVSAGKNSMGIEDIFEITLSESSRPEALELVKGKVYNAKTMQEIDAEVYYDDLLTGKRLGSAYSTVQDGFQIALPKGYKYGFQANVPGFMPIAENVDLTDLNDFRQKTADLYVVPVEQGQDFSLQNIFFDGATANLSPESFLELDRLAEMMRLNPSIRIEIGNNMINGGLKADQLNVLQARMTAIQNYLAQKSVDINRVKTQIEEIKLKPSLNISNSGEIRIKLF
ncbi:MAG: PD40 domain-containing protein [Crocinitomicaceae bacterium]|nr:PD40 domain-containing protein [Crocinitomicaceae bacterium]